MAPVPDPDSKASTPPQRPGWRGSDLLRAALALGVVWAAFQLLWTAHSILFLIFLGVLLGLALSSGADRMGRWGVPRGVGVSAIVLGLLGLVVLGGAIVWPTVRDQGERLAEEVPQALEDFGRWLDEGEPGIRNLFREGIRGDESEEEDEEAEAEEPGADGDDDAGQEPLPDTLQAQEEDPDEEEATAEVIRSRLAGQIGGLGERFVGFLGSTTAVMAGILLILFVAIYFAASPETYRKGVLALVPPRKRSVAEEVMAESALLLRRWLVAQVISMVVIGTCTTVILLLFGVPGALALGIFAGLMEFIPIVGPIIAAIPAIAMAFTVSPQTGLYVALAYLVLQQLEAQILIPLLMKKGIDLPPVLTVSIQSLMAIVFGFVGLLVAVPLVAAVLLAVKILYVREVLGQEVELPSRALVS